MVGVLEESMRSVAPDAAICIVSDHGMARVEHELNLRGAFVKAGLIKPAVEPKAAKAPAIAELESAALVCRGLGRDHLKRSQ